MTQNSAYFVLQKEYRPHELELFHSQSLKERLPPALRLQFSPGFGQFSSSFGTPPDLSKSGPDLARPGVEKTKATKTVTSPLYYPPMIKSG